MHIVGPSFIFNIFFYPRPDLPRSNSPIFKNMILFFPVGFLPILC